MTQRRRPRETRTDLSKREQTALRRKWRRWSRELVRDVGDLLWSRQLFDDLNEIGRHNPAIGKPPAFLDWIRANYAAAVSVGVRRLIDTDRRSISLGRLLFELIEHPGTITRAYHVSLYPIHLHEAAERSFDNLAGGGRRFVAERDVRSDLRRIENAAQRVYRLVNKRIAHKARPGALRRLPTYDELHRSLDMLDRLTVKYHVLLTAEGYSTCYATPQFTWTDVLAHPWLTPGHPMRRSE